MLWPCEHAAAPDTRLYRAHVAVSAGQRVTE